jgi:diguanylate cyclase (GGDEF)-like protein/PAS domain S-box-containing protein
MPNFVKIIGLSSIRGRFLLVSVFFVLGLLIAAWIGQNKVNETTSSNLNLSSERQILARTMQQIINHVWQTKNSLQKYMLEPKATTKKEFLENINKAISTASELDKTGWVQKIPKVQQHALVLQNNLRRIKSSGLKVMHLRINPVELYPAVGLMIHDLLPVNAEFISVSSLSIDEAFELYDQPQQKELHRLYSDLRYAWVSMISAFRNIVANRFGIFGDPKAGMRGQSQNVYLYAERIVRDIKQIRAIQKKIKPGFDQTGAPDRLSKLYQKWFKGFRKVTVLLNSKQWRKDTPILQNTIQPQFQAAWSHIQQIQDWMDKSTTEGVIDSSKIASELGATIWLFALAGFILCAMIYLFFERTIRKPLSQVVKALKDEAHGKPAKVPSTGTMEETSDLIDAFSYMRKQVRSRQLRLETILDNAAEGIVTFDADGVIEGFNLAAEKLFGYDDKEVVGKDIGVLIPPDSKYDRRDGYLEHFLRAEIKRLIGHEGEVTGKHKDGSRFPMALKISSLILDGKQMYTGLVSDISERKALMAHLKNLAEHDGLTGLYNRSYFQSELDHLVERCKRGETDHYALLYIDLDNFKYVNDVFGHAAGDDLLIKVSQILLKRLRKTDLLSRFGGDEFTALLHKVTPQIAEDVANDLRDQLACYPFKFRDKSADVGCSIGICIIDNKSNSPEEVLSRADFACNQAKRNGRNRIYTYNDSDAEKVTAMTIDMGWSRRIKDALESNKFVLGCQPIVKTHSRDIVFYEVLIRMIDENDELILPGGFLPSAERFGLSIAIDSWVVEHAINTLVQQRKTIPNIAYSINLSAQTLSQTNFCDFIEEKIKGSGIAAEALCFEITETVAISDMQLAENFLGRLQELGCKTALDDFGSGFSSFGYLQDLPVDFVKIDGRFVKNMAANSIDQSMVRAMNDIAHALGKKTIAEFVEDEASMALLSEIGVDFAQGFYLGRPDVVTPCQDILLESSTNAVCKF